VATAGVSDGAGAGIGVEPELMPGGGRSAPPVTGSGNGADPEPGIGIGTAAPPATGSGIGALPELGVGVGIIGPPSAAAGVGVKPAGIAAAKFNPATLVDSGDDDAGIGPSATFSPPEGGTAGGVTGAGRSLALLGAAAGAAGPVVEFGAVFAGVDVVDATAAGAALRVPSTVISIFPLLLRRTKS
jgi:hypothetical protein